MSIIVARSQAMRAKTRHQFIQGVGYLPHGGPPELEPHQATGTKNCDPPEMAIDGSQHMLRPPNGAPPRIFVWVKAEKAWEAFPFGVGNRLAWPASHLMKASWEYVGPA